MNITNVIALEEPEVFEGIWSSIKKGTIKTINIQKRIGFGVLTAGLSEVPVSWWKKTGNVFKSGGSAIMDKQRANYRNKAYQGSSTPLMIGGAMLVGLAVVLVTNK